MAHGVQLAHPGGGGLAIEHVAVGVRDARRVVGALRAALDLDGGDARVRKIVQVVEHGEVVGAQDVAPGVVLLHGHAAHVRARLFHQGPAPAARLGARAEARAALAADELARQQAAAAHGHAHGAVGEDLQLQRREPVRVQASAQVRDLAHAHLARKDDAACAQAGVLLCRERVHDGGLRGHVQLHVRRVPAHKRHGTQVRHDGGVHPNLVHEAQVVW